MLDRLTETIAAVCPIHGLSKKGESVTIDYKPEATPEELIAAQLALTTFDWSQSAHDVWMRGKRRESALAMLQSPNPDMIALRAALKLIKEAFDQLRADTFTTSGVLTMEQLIDRWVEIIASGDVDQGIV